MPTEKTKYGKHYRILRQRFRPFPEIWTAVDERTNKKVGIKFEDVDSKNAKK